MLKLQTFASILCSICQYIIYLFLVFYHKSWFLVVSISWVLLFHHCLFFLRKCVHYVSVAVYLECYFSLTYGSFSFKLIISDLFISCRMSHFSSVKLFGSFYYMASWSFKYPMFVLVSVNNLTMFISLDILLFYIELLNLSHCTALCNVMGIHHLFGVLWGSRESCSFLTSCKL